MQHFLTFISDRKAQNTKQTFSYSEVSKTLSLDLMSFTVKRNEKEKKTKHDIHQEVLHPNVKPTKNIYISVTW